MRMIYSVNVSQHNKEENEEGEQSKIISIVDTLSSVLVEKMKKCDFNHATK